MRQVGEDQIEPAPMDRGEEIAPVDLDLGGQVELPEQAAGGGDCVGLEIDAAEGRGAQPARGGEQDAAAAADLEHAGAANPIGWSLSVWSRAAVYWLGQNAVAGAGGSEVLTHHSDAAGTMGAAQTMDMQLGDAIAGRRFEDLAVAGERGRVIAGNQGRERLPGEARELLRLGRGLQLGADAVGPEQLVDRDARAPALDGDLVDRPHAQTVAGFAVGVVADAGQRAVGLVDALQPRRRCSRRRR